MAVCDQLKVYRIDSWRKWRRHWNSASQNYRANCQRTYACSEAIVRPKLRWPVCLWQEAHLAMLARAAKGVVRHVIQVEWRSMHTWTAIHRSIVYTVRRPVSLVCRLSCIYLLWPMPRPIYLLESVKLQACKTNNSSNKMHHMSSERIH